MNEIKISWNESFFVNSTTAPNSDKNMSKIQITKQIIKVEILNYLNNIRKQLYFALLVLIVGGIIMVGAETDSYTFIIGEYLVFLVVGVRFVFTVILCMFFLPITIYCSVFFGFNKSCEISEKGIFYYNDKKKKKVIHLSDIKKILIKELKYPNFSVWELQIRDKYKKQYRIKFPHELKSKIFNVLHLLKLPAVISDKPQREVLF